MIINIREKVLDEIRINDSGYVSGEEIGQKLGITRAAVWKHVKSLKSSGYCIDSSSKKGYRLTGSGDILNTVEIGHDLKTDFMGKEIIYFKEIDSTNLYAKKNASKCREGTTIIADFQNAGRGRLGRSWTSSEGKGIWMSLVLKPEIEPGAAQIITIGAAVAVTESIFECFGIKTGIKWPNDIILDGRKLCGILTEMSSEIDRIDYIIVGIGINVNQEEIDFPAEIRNIAVSLKSHVQDSQCTDNFNRAKLLKEILYQFEDIYIKIINGKANDITDLWKKYSVTIGSRISVNTAKGIFEGVATNLTHEGRLVVKCNDGSIREFNSGEVSIRGIMGY